MFSSIPGGGEVAAARGPVGVSLVALLAVATLAGCADRPPAAAGDASPPPVESASPEPTSDTSPAEGFLAVVLPSRQVDVSAELDGVLSRVDVDVGDQVRPGDPIASIEVRDLVEERDMASASLTALEADERRADVHATSAQERYERRLPHQDLYSAEEMLSLAAQAKEAAAELESAKARVAEQRSRLEQIAAQLRRARLDAPIAGTVSERYLDPGALVHKGSAVVRLIGLGGVLLRFAVPPEETGRLRLDAEVRFRAADRSVTIPATVTRIAPQVDSASGMVFMEAEVPAREVADPSLQPGLVGRILVDASADQPMSEATSPGMPGAS